MAQLNKIIFFVRYQDETENAYDSTVSLHNNISWKAFDTRQENYVSMALRACVTSSTRGLYIF